VVVASGIDLTWLGSSLLLWPPGFSGDDLPMTFELYQLFLVCLVYLCILFGVAQAAEKQWIPRKVIRHPITYVLSLGVFASAWAFYGVVSLAHEYGYGFLSYYLGITVAFLLASLILIPLWRLCRTYMLSSLADLLAFRYRNQTAGSLVTLCMLVAVLPLLALQIQAISETTQILSSENNTMASNIDANDRLALTYCVLIGGFAMLFGAKQLTAHERHDGLVTAVAFESLLKVVVLLTVGFISLNYIFGGLDGLTHWLEANPHIIELLNSPVREDSSRTLLVIFFSAAIVMPHLFHMIITENPSAKTLRTASWGAPLFLFFISLPVLPILWGGYNTNTFLTPEYYTLSIGIDLNLPWLSLLTYVGGVSAASSVIIVMTLALASMCLKHLILPFYRPSSDRDIHGWLLWVRRLLVLCIILAGYIFYRVMVSRESLSNLGIASFIATLQFFPGVFATLYWQRANSKGFIAGLIAGFGFWFMALLRPIISETDPEFISRFYFTYAYEDLWHLVTLISLALNCLVFIGVSLLTRTSAEEKAAAEACSTDDISRPIRRLLSIQSAEEMQARLTTALGRRSAQREMERALNELQLEETETRPYSLRLLRNRIETNLSNIMGPTVAREMIEQLLPYEESDDTSRTEDINFIEGQLEKNQGHLTGLAADLDSLRRHHRKTLQDLPVGVCALGRDHEILMWNNAIAELTHIGVEDTIGARLGTLAEPWQTLFKEFINSPEQHWLKKSVEVESSTFWVNLHKTNTHDENGDQVIVIEDATELQQLGQSLKHSERLASIGQLAAGVAHEIGNPITGIACLAQNLRYDTENPESLTTADEILGQTQRVTRIVQTLVNFAHAGKPQDDKELETVNLHECVAEAIHLLALNQDVKPISIVNLCEENLCASGDHQRLLQVLINLINNARDASPANSTIEVATAINGSQLELTVTDQGSGISEAEQEKIFDPFFTTKEAGEGTGLGLYLVYNIIQDMEGHISVKSPIDEQLPGTRFTISLRHLP
jgi:Na+/proline symporter/signal transduction histidine kinase